MPRWGNLTDAITNLLGKALDCRTQSQKVIAANVANLDTPNYTGKDLNFKDTLANSLQRNPKIRLTRTNPEHIPGAGLDLSLQVQDTQKPVDIDQEMIKLTQNNLHYRANVQMLIKKLYLLQAAIEGGK